MRALVFVAALALVGCPSLPSVEIDASVDTGHDAGATVDAGHDAGFDAGPTCECSAGACCDGCHFRPASYVCQDVVASGCSGASLCASQGRIAEVNHDYRACSGASQVCNGATSSALTASDCRVPNGVDFLTYGRCDPTGVAHCVDGPSCSATW